MQRIAIAGILAAAGTAGTIMTCDTEGECTLEARPSVHVKVVENIDGRLVPVKADDVQYRIKQDPTQGDQLIADWLRADCSDNSCQEWIAGLEVEGEFEIAATVCGETFTDMALVERTEDGCHVATQELVLEVNTRACAAAPTDPSGVIESGEVDCTREARPSVIAQVAKREGDMVIPVEPEKIQWWHRELEGPFEPKCADEKCSRYEIGVEQEGAFTIVANYCEADFKAHVDVPKTDDGCHVETQIATIIVDTAGCYATERGVDDEGPHDSPTLKAAEDGRPPNPADRPDDIDAAVCPTKIMDTPAFMLNVVREDQDMWIPTKAEKVTFFAGKDETVHEATCADDNCTKWSAQHEVAGRYGITATVCGKDFKISAPIEKTADGCDLETAWLAVMVDQSGCIAESTPRPATPTPPPGTPTR